MASQAIKNALKRLKLTKLAKKLGVRLGGDKKKRKKKKTKRRKKRTTKRKTTKRRTKRKTTKRKTTKRRKKKTTKRGPKAAFIAKVKRSARANNNTMSTAQAEGLWKARQARKKGKKKKKTTKKRRTKKKKSRAAASKRWRVFAETYDGRTIHLGYYPTWKKADTAADYDFDDHKDSDDFAYVRVREVKRKKA